MKNQLINTCNWHVYTLLFTFFSVSYACHKEWDQPPAYLIPDIKATHSIKSLKSLHSFGGYELITDDIIIRGIISGNDKSGNLYKQICIQDSTGGITINMGRSNLYLDYPVGREVFIKCKGLCISDVNRMIQLGMLDKSVPFNPTLSVIPSPFLDSFVVKSMLDNVIKPVKLTIDQLNDLYQSMLVQLDSVQFAAGDTAKNLGDTSTFRKPVSLTLHDCSGNKTVVYTSAYADFAGMKPPSQKGSIIALYFVYHTTTELIIRDIADLHFNSVRCTNTLQLTLFSEKFTTISNNEQIALTGWKNIGETGGQNFMGYVSGTSRYAKITALGSGQKQVTSWLISPPINIPSGIINPVLSFQTVDGYDNGATLKCLISNDFDGNNKPSASTWTELPAKISSGHTSSFGTNLNSGNIDLSTFKGKTIRLAFRYDGSDITGNKKNTTFELNNINITGY